MSATRGSSKLTEEQVPIRSEADILRARRKGKEMAEELEFSATDVVLITTAISELARNILLYARTGEIVLKRLEQKHRQGIQVVARDRGPGIPDIARAMRHGYSSSGTLGLGLPGVRRLMDEMGIESTVGSGTTVTAKKWKP